MVSDLKNTLRTHLINFPGWRTTRKLIVFESDDWGSIRMPSKEVYASLLKNGIAVNKSKYDELDGLENREDLEALFELISQYKDHKGNYPKFTFNTVMGNPDFEKMKAASYESYFFETLFDSYKYYHKDDLAPLWFEGISKGLIMPQFHAKEHFNVGLLMHDLALDNKETRIALEHGFFGLKTQTSSVHQKSYLAAYYATNPEELKQRVAVLKEGLSLFESVFGFKSETFIACNYVWPKELEFYLNQYGVKGIQGNYTQKRPVLEKEGKLKLIRNYTGKRNEYDQVYTVRNVKFEPFENQHYDWVASAMKEIEIAFRYQKPAIIGTHRVNYVGGMSPPNATDSRNKLTILLQSLLTRWPDVEFMSSNELVGLLQNENNER